MAVTKITEDWEDRAVTQEAVEGDNQRPKILLRAERAFDVEFDNSDTPDSRPLLASYADDGTTKVPMIWERHPFHQWLYVKRKDVDVKGPLHFRVIVHYECELDMITQTPISPLMQQPDISWAFAGSNVQIDTDTAGLPITNSAGESFDPPITKDHSDLVLRYTRNEETFDRLRAADYKDAVNSDTFLGFPAGHVLCTLFEADQRIAGALIYYRVRYEFRIRYDEVKTKDTSGDVQTVVFGWIKRIRDEGYRERTGETNPDGSPKYSPITDENGQNVSQPHPLDGSGKKLKDSVIEDPPLPESCFLKFDVLKKRPFSVLNI